MKFAGFVGVNASSMKGCHRYVLLKTETMYMKFLFAITLLLAAKILCSQSRCDGNEEESPIFLITEVMPVPNIQFEQLEGILDNSINLNSFVRPAENMIYVSFIINCKGEDFNYKVVQPTDIDSNLRGILISTIQSNLNWTSAVHNGKAVDIQYQITIKSEGNKFNILSGKEARKKKNK